MLDTTASAPRFRWLLVAALTVLLSVHSAGAGIAQDDGADPDVRANPVTWGISPATAEGRDTRSVISEVVDPGTTLTDHVVVDNFGEQPITLDLYAADTRPAEGAFDVAAADEPSETVGAWIELSDERVEIPARDHVIVELTLRVPNDAEPGDHAGGVLASRRTSEAGGDVGIETERRVGARVHLRVDGPVRPGFAVSDLHATYDQRVNPAGRGTTTADFRIENAGNIRLSGEIQLVVSGPFGLGRRSVPGPPIEDLLPGHGIDHQLDVDQVLPLGRLHVEAQVLATHSANQPLAGEVPDGEASTTLWAFPYSTLAALAALLIAAWALRRRRRAAAAVDADADVEPPPSERPTPEAARGG